MLDLLLAAGTVLVVGLYARGWSRTPAGSNDARPAARGWAFAAGFAVVVGALAPPLERAAETTLAAHMAQHVLLLAVAPPLLVAGRSGSIIARGLSSRLAGAARRVRRAASRIARRAGVPIALGAVGGQAAVMGVWHLPGPFDAALRSEPLHALEHASFLGSSLVLWWVIAHAAAHGRPAVAVLCVFGAGLACTALGALLVLARSPWYSHYWHGGRDAALADQQVAGAVMWGFANLALAVAGAVVVGTWLVTLERRTPSRLRTGGIS